MDNCIFCNIVNGTSQIKPYLKNDDWIIISDKNAIAPEHMLVISTKHDENLSQLSGRDRNYRIASAFDLIEEYVNEHDNQWESGYRIVINTGKDAGQTVQHLHIHLLGGDQLKNDFGT